MKRKMREYDEQKRARGQTRRERLIYVDCSKI